MPIPYDYGPREPSEMAGTDPLNERGQSVDAVAEHRGIARDTGDRWSGEKVRSAGRVERLWMLKPSEVVARLRAGWASEGASESEVPAGAGRALAGSSRGTAR